MGKEGGRMGDREEEERDKGNRGWDTEMSPSFLPVLVSYGCCHRDYKPWKSKQHMLILSFTSRVQKSKLNGSPLHDVSQAHWAGSWEKLGESVPRILGSDPTLYLQRLLYSPLPPSYLAVSGRPIFCTVRVHLLCQFPGVQKGTS